MGTGNRITKGRRGVKKGGGGFVCPKAFPRVLLDLNLSRNNDGIRVDRPLGSSISDEVGSCCSIPCIFDITRGSSLVVTHCTADV